MTWNGPWRGRSLTILFAVGVAATLFLPLPGLGVGLLEPMQNPGLPWVREELRLFSLGVSPYLNSAGLLLLASGLIPRLRRWREGGPGERRAFDASIVGISMFFAAGTAFAAGVYARHLGAPIPLVMLAATAFAAYTLLLACALGVTRAGIGNGVALAWFAISYLPQLALGLGRGRSPVMLGAVPLLVVAYARVLEAAEVLPLERTDGGASGSPLAPASSSTGAEGDRRGGAPGPNGAEIGETSTALRLRWNLLGLLPATWAWWGLVLFKSGLGLFGPRPLLEWLRSPWGKTGATTLLALGAAWLLLGLAYDPRQLARTLARHGYRMRGIPEGGLAKHMAKRVWVRLPIALALAVVIELAPLWLARVDGANGLLARSLGWPLFVGTAIVLQMWRQDRSLGSLVSSSGGASAWRVIAEPDTELEAELLRDRLAREGVAAHVISNRAIPVLGTFALWEWTRPRAASLVLHRRLGGGAVSLVTAAADAARAHEIVAGIQPVAAPADDL